MGFFDHDIDNAFDSMFDFDHDGRNSAIENAAKWQFFDEYIANDDSDDEEERDGFFDDDNDW